MTPHTKARTCTAAALLSATAALTASTWHPALAIPGTASAICLWLVAASYRADHQRATLAFQTAREETPYPDPAPMPDYERIDEQARYDETFADMIRHWNEDAA